MRFLRKYRERIIVTSVAIILLVLIGVTNNRENLSKGEKIAGNILTPVSKVTFNIGKSISDFVDTLLNFRSIKSENEQLKEYIVVLEDENRDLENLIGKSDFLKSEAEILRTTSFNTLKAQVSGKEPSNWFNNFTIDKGLDDGIQSGESIIQGVEVDDDLYQEGIIGRVTDVGDNWAKVVSIIDETSNISFIITRTQDGGILQGTIEGELRGYLFDDKADVIVGDTVYTSGLGGVFAENLYIGEVIEVIEEEESLTKQIIVSPAIDFKRIQNVLVITSWSGGKHWRFS